MYKYLLIFVAPLLSNFVHGQNQNPGLIKLKTASLYSSNGIYNSESNKLLYYGLIADQNNQIKGSVIAVRDLDDSTEQIIETNTAYPALGWVDSSRVLIYRTFRDPNKPIGSLSFKNDYPRALFVYDLITKEKTAIDSIPLKETLNKMVVDRNTVVYQTGIFKKSKVFKYSLINKKTFQFSAIKGYSINHTNFIYRGVDSLLLFVAFQNEHLFYMNSINKRGEIDTLFKVYDPIGVFCFDQFRNRVYFEVSKTVLATGDENYNSGKSEIHSYDFGTKEIKIHHSFDKKVLLTKVSCFAPNELIVSLSVPTKNIVKQNAQVGDTRIGVSTPYEENLYILKIEN